MPWSCNVDPTVVKEKRGGAKQWRIGLPFVCEVSKKQEVAVKFPVVWGA